MIGEQLRHCQPPIVNIDILGNYVDLYDEKFCVVVHKDSDMIDFIERFDWSKEQPRMVVVLTDNPDATIEYACLALEERFYSTGMGGTLALDEVDGFDKWNTPNFDKMVRYGRNWNVDILTGCRRPAEIMRNITANANCFYIFETNESRDVKFFDERFPGIQAERLIYMEEYHGIFINYDNKETGIFKTNEKGEVFLLEKTPFKQQKDEIT